MPVTISNLAQHFIPIAVRSVEKTTDDCVLVSFEVPEAQKQDFRFSAGQHLTLRREIGGEEVRRSYSICSAPGSGNWKVAIKQIPEGVFSRFANQELRAGDVLDVMAPHGNFTLEPSVDKPAVYVGFAAGSGITPLISHIHDKLENEPSAHFMLFYASQTASSIILKEELEGLKNRYLSRFEPYFFLTREERDIEFYNGRIDLEKLEHIAKYILDLPEVDHFLLCGPEDMIFMIRDFLQVRGVEEKRIHFELFVSNAALQKKAIVRPETEAGPGTEVTVREGGKNFRFRMGRNSESVLEAALRYNSGLPFACKGGVCCTCRAKLIEGKVEMHVNYALEKEELEAGYILTCQAVPLTETITVDFDQ